MMNDNRLLRITRLLLMACLTMLTMSCRETMEQLFGDDIEAGDEVQFTAVMQQRASTRGVTRTVDLSTHYQLTVGMYTDETTKVGNDGTYIVSKDVSEEGSNLEAVTPLYWPDNITKYGFKAVAGSKDLSVDQSTAKDWLLQDRLEGGTSMYLTAKDWKSTIGSNIVPLDMHHTRSLITIVLKAGEGVSEKSLTVANDLNVTVYSHSEGEVLAIKPLASNTMVSYDAIVMPYDYATNSSSLITQIVLSGQKYSFYASNDDKFESDATRYNLQAGQHLIITVTLGRDSRHVLMTAQIEDWTEEVTDVICDDHGYFGSPIEIPSRDRLIEFLTSPTENKAGNLAIITKSFDLGTWPDDGDEPYNLNCSLSLGGKTLTSSKRFLNSIGSAASLLNGTIQITGSVDEAIAETNSGTINDIEISAAGTGACATVAGAVKTNQGVISKCRSSLKVAGSSTESYVGGIAAISESPQGKTAVIDGCTVTNSVKGGTHGGGIVGEANGKITNNTFEYGITLGQDSTTHKNIAFSYSGSDFTNNAWPTVVNGQFKNATPAANRYTGIIDATTEFGLTAAGGRYRLAQDITVNSSLGDVDYELDGNDRKITTDKMIFKAITGKVHDLKVYVSDNLIAEHKDEDKDVIAPLAYEVHGTGAEISHVKVLMADGKRIQAANPAGLVVWAWAGATVSNCEVSADIQSLVATPKANEKKYAGGIVAAVSKAKVTQCVFHSAGSISGVDGATCVYYGGIVGGIEQKANSGENPELIITDCTCYKTFTDDVYHGCILGYYEANDGAKSSQGNWWDASCKGVGNVTGSGESAIGKRNSITPKEVELSF